MIKSLHHNAYRCRDSEDTRRFLWRLSRAAASLGVGDRDYRNRAWRQCAAHSLQDGRRLVPGVLRGAEQAFEFKRQHDFDLHIALEVDRQTLMEMFERGKAEGIETRGISDHEFIDSVYFRDPDGYVIERATNTVEEHVLDPARARAALDEWQAAKGPSGEKT